MRDLPIIFPISLVVLLIVLFFTGAYAVSAGAAADQQNYVSIGESTDDNNLFEKGALFVCPFH